MSKNNDFIIKGLNIQKIDEMNETMNLINLIKPYKDSEIKFEGKIKEEIEEKEKIDKMTETMNLIGIIEPSKNLEIKYEGIIKEQFNIKEKIDETTETMNLKDLIEPSKHLEIQYESNINTEIKEKEENNINNNIIISNETNLDIYNNIKKKNNILNYNSVNEIEIGEALEINPYEIKRTKSNIIITYENGIEVLKNKNDIFNQKAKKNMIKIILPLKLKSTLIKNTRKQNYAKLFARLKKIRFISHLNNIAVNYEKKMKKEGIKKIKEKMNDIKLRNYIRNEIRKYEMRKIMKKYVENKWYKGLIELAKMAVNNK